MKKKTTENKCYGILIIAMFVDIKNSDKLEIQRVK